jgi:hypothetical protein
MSSINVEDLPYGAQVWAPKIVNKGLASDAMGEGVDDIDISDIQDLFSPLPPYHSHHQKKNLLISIRKYI